MKWDRFTTLMEKEVINVFDGRRLGYVCDLEMDTANGRICSLIVPLEGERWNFFAKEQAYCIPWRCIKRIGDDIVLVELDASAMVVCEN